MASWKVNFWKYYNLSSIGSLGWVMYPISDMETIFWVSYCVRWISQIGFRPKAVGKWVGTQPSGHLPKKYTLKNLECHLKPILSRTPNIEYAGYESTEKFFPNQNYLGHPCWKRLDISQFSGREKFGELQFTTTKPGEYACYESWLFWPEKFRKRTQLGQ